MIARVAPSAHRADGSAGSGSRSIRVRCTSCCPSGTFRPSVAASTGASMSSPTRSTIAAAPDAADPCPLPWRPDDDHGGADPTAKPDPTLIKALRPAQAMVGRDEAGQPLFDAAPDTPWRRRLVRLAFLAPELQHAILDGRQPADPTLARLMDGSLPLLWSEQARVLGIAAIG